MGFGVGWWLVGFSKYEKVGNGMKRGLWRWGVSVLLDY
jgi:hypothetical protein